MKVQDLSSYRTARTGRTEGQQDVPDSTLMEELKAAPSSPTDERAFMGNVDAAWHDSARPLHKVIVITLCTLLAFFLIWATWAEVDEVTRGQGQVIAAQRNQVIQHLEGGILTELLVRENARVEQGQVLARVDNVAAESHLRDTHTRLWGQRAAIERLQAEIEERPPNFSPELQQEIPSVVKAESNIYEAHVRKQEQEIRLLDSQCEQKRQEMEELEGRKKTFERALPIATRRAELALPLMKRNLYPEVEYLSLQQEMNRLAGEIKSLSVAILKAQSAIDELVYKKRLYQADYHSQLVNEINKFQAEAASLEEILTTGSDRIMRTELKSPVRGIVNRIFLNTKGGVVKAGEPIMDIVPLDSVLVVEAKIRPADIAFIHAQQKAIIKLTAYDYTTYGGLEAEVESISADTVESKSGETFYLVKLAADRSSVLYRGQELPVIPGMVASVDIFTGKKTIMTYLLKPIIKAKDSALRER